MEAQALPDMDDGAGRPRYRPMRMPANLVAALLVLGLTATPAVAFQWPWMQANPAEQQASREQVKAGLAAGRILVVDVREPYEFAAGHIPGAVNMPMSRFDPARLPPPDGRSVVLMCEVGNRSSRATRSARAAGRTDVLNYVGSMADWRRSGGPIARAAN